jgi:alpha-ketoglutarate-dependent taurine dioxygenase
MSKGMIIALACGMVLAGQLAAQSTGEIYKVVDEEGNVTFTDQRPSDDAQPVDLPPLSVIETEIAVPPTSGSAPGAGEEEQAPTMKELRRQFRDFRITQPQQEETFWGTANTVVVAWGSSETVPPEFSARLYVDGEAQAVPGSGSMTLTLDRGEHQVYVELLDARKRQIIRTETITFFVKQHSAHFNRPGPTLQNSSP